MRFQHLVYPYCRCDSCRKGRIADREEANRLQQEDNAVIKGRHYTMPQPWAQANPDLVELAPTVHAPGSEQEFAALQVREDLVEEHLSNKRAWLRDEKARLRKHIAFLEKSLAELEEAD